MLGATAAWVARRESRRVREVFLLGTAIICLSLYLRGNRQFVPHPPRYFKARAGQGSVTQLEILELVPTLVGLMPAAPAGTSVEVLAAVRTKTLARLRAKHLPRKGEHQGFSGNAVHIDHQVFHERAQIGLLPPIFGSRDELLLPRFDLQSGLLETAGAGSVNPCFQGDLHEKAAYDPLDGHGDVPLREHFVRCSTQGEGAHLKGVRVLEPVARAQGEVMQVEYHLTG